MGRAIRERHVECADCRIPMRLQGKFRLAYSCPKCSASLTADEHGRPRGIPGTEEDRRWRRQAQVVFDRLWRSSDFTRSATQRWLARELGISVKQCHFLSMRVKILRRVVEICDEVHQGKRQGPYAIDDDKRRSTNRRMASEAVKLLRRTGAHPIAVRYWIARHVGIPRFVDVGGLSRHECERLISIVTRAFSGELKLPRHGKLNKKLKLEMLRRMTIPRHMVDD